MNFSSILIPIISVFGLLISGLSSSNERVSIGCIRQLSSFGYYGNNKIFMEYFLSKGEIVGIKSVHLPVYQYYSPLLSQFETAYPPPVIPTGTPEVGTENIPSPTSTASILEVTMIFPTNTPSRTPSPTDAKIPGEKAKIQDSKNTTSYGLIFLVAILWLLLGGWLYLLIREKG